MAAATEGKGSSIASIPSMAFASTSETCSPRRAAAAPGALSSSRMSSSASAGASTTTPAGAG
eukprot:11839679-Alexandrium_andersonii.AAC.1